MLTISLTCMLIAMRLNTAEVFLLLVITGLTSVTMEQATALAL